MFIFSFCKFFKLHEIIGFFKYICFPSLYFFVYKYNSFIFSFMFLFSTTFNMFSCYLIRIVLKKSSLASMWECSVEMLWILLWWTCLHRFSLITEHSTNPSASNEEGRCYSKKEKTHTIIKCVPPVFLTHTHTHSYNYHFIKQALLPVNMFTVMQQRRKHVIV